MSSRVVTYAEAQQRAEEWINEGVPAYQRREVRVREFDLGFVAWAVDRADGPSSDGGAVRMVIARDSGVTTLWPALPINDVVRRYEEAYGRPVGATPAGTQSPPERGLAEATSFLLSPPQWLEEAGAAAMAAESARAAGAGGSGSGSARGAEPDEPSLLVAPPVSAGPPGEVPTMLARPPERSAGPGGQGQQSGSLDYAPTMLARPGAAPAGPGPVPPQGGGQQGGPYGGGQGGPPPPPPGAFQGGPAGPPPPPPSGPPAGGPGLPPPPPPGLVGPGAGPGTPAPPSGPPAGVPGMPPPPPPGVIGGGPAGPPPPPPGGPQGGSLDYAPTMLARPGSGPAVPPPPPSGPPVGGRGLPPPPPPGLVGPGAGPGTPAPPSGPPAGVPGMPPPPPPAGLHGGTPPRGVSAPSATGGDSYVPTQFAQALNLPPRTPGGPGGPAVPPPPPAPQPQQAPPQAAPGVPTVGPGYMAVLRYRGPDGSEQQIIQRSTLGLPHPEWQILQEVRRLNVPPEQVLELHTELESCDLPGGYCQRMVKEAWPNVRVSSIAPYGRDHAARQRGVQHLFEHHGELHTHAAGPAPQRPFRVPLPAPGSVQPAPPVPPQALADELQQAFGPQNVFRYEPQAVSRQGIPEVVSGSLTWAGLPVEFGPFFWAQAQPGRPMPTLAELAAERGIAAQPDAGTYLVLGNDYGRQLCVQYGTAAIVAVDLGTATQPAGVEAQQPRFVNTGLPEFLRCMALLGRMWRFRYGLTPEQAGHWTTDFQAQLAALDPAALGSPETWWAVLLEQLWDGLL
ncbi:SUKH-4 family immunity protein [Streptacidiphilus sp. EB103A]|uniref:SUKH-4 family immunity protein n=1 Tax=Streptacidiphilus sp. EB103A TaxID=3156275 RepID=UPI003513DAC4